MGFGPTAAHTQDTRDITEYPFSPVFVYPTSWGDAEIAADLFVALTSIALGECARDDERPFKTWHNENGFHVRDHVNPTHAFYREVARLAEAGAFRLCAHCGWPFLADRSRDNGGMYCSSSCNTKASAARRELAYALAAAGTPHRGCRRPHRGGISPKHRAMVRRVGGAPRLDRTPQRPYAPSHEVRWQ